MQVFGTSPEEHAEAMERVKKAKVRLPPTWADADQRSARVQGLGVEGAQGWVHAEPREALTPPPTHRLPHMP